MPHRSIAEKFNQKFCRATAGWGVQSFQQLLSVTCSTRGAKAFASSCLSSRILNFVQRSHEDVWRERGWALGTAVAAPGLSVGLPFGKNNVTPMATGLWYYSHDTVANQWCPCQRRLEYLLQRDHSR